MYALADCNNFFASCERVFRPELNGKPVIVLSNNDGCAVARSNEAKALGIKMGDPYFKIRDIVERNGVAVFSGNFPLYGDMSRRVQEVLRGFAPSVEQYSIDEAFLDLSGMDHIDFDAYAKRISATCLKWTAIPVSVGIAPTKTLAKIASKLCKQYPRLRGGCYLHRPQDIEKVLRKFPVGDVWGIGRRSLKKLEQMGVRSAWDYVQLSETTVRKLFFQPGFHTWKELQGIPCIEFEDLVEPKQSICVSRSFAHEIEAMPELCEQVANFAESAVQKLFSHRPTALRRARRRPPPGSAYRLSTLRRTTARSSLPPSMPAGNSGGRASATNGPASSSPKSSRKPISSARSGKTTGRHSGNRAFRSPSTASPRPSGRGPSASAPRATASSRPPATTSPPTTPPAGKICRKSGYNSKF